MDYLKADTNDVNSPKFSACIIAGSLNNELIHAKFSSSHPGKVPGLIQVSYSDEDWEG